MCYKQHGVLFWWNSLDSWLGFYSQLMWFLCKTFFIFIFVAFSFIWTLCYSHVFFFPVADISSRHLITDTSSENRKKLYHVPVPGNVEDGQTYLMLAFEVALIGNYIICFLFHAGYFYDGLHTIVLNCSVRTAKCKLLPRNYTRVCQGLSLTGLICLHMWNQLVLWLFLFCHI